MYLTAYRFLIKLVTCWLPRQARKRARKALTENDPVFLLRRWYNHARYRFRKAGQKLPPPPKIAIYTAITGSYDKIRDHSWLCPEWDYFCFTNDEMPNFLSWKVLPINNAPCLDDSKVARYQKLSPHLLLKNYEYSIWVDANCDICDSYLYERVNSIINDPLFTIAIPRHRDRICIYKEADSCKHRNKDIQYSIGNVVDFLKEQQYPEEYGLAETGIIVRRHNESSVVRLMDLWWNMVCEFSKRDQLSFDFSRWVLNAKVHDLLEPGQSLLSSRHFRFRAHTPRAN